MKPSEAVERRLISFHRRPGLIRAFVRATQLIEPDRFVRRVEKGVRKVEEDVRRRRVVGQAGQSKAEREKVFGIVGLVLQGVAAVEQEESVSKRRFVRGEVRSSLPVKSLVEVFLLELDCEDVGYIPLRLVCKTSKSMRH